MRNQKNEEGRRMYPMGHQLTRMPGQRRAVRGNEASSADIQGTHTGRDCPTLAQFIIEKNLHKWRCRHGSLLAGASICLLSPFTHERCQAARVLLTAGDKIM